MPPETAATSPLTLANEARAAVRRGWALTPMAGKQAILKAWTSQPVPDEATVLSWAEKGNLGVRTGQISGVVVIDDDTPDGSGAAHLDLPMTATVATGGGGKHYYFRRPDGGLGNSTGKLAEHVDVRGDGGVAVMVGSTHPETGALYEWMPGMSPEEIPIADLPEHIVTRLRPLETKAGNKATPARGAAGQDRRLLKYAEAALRNCTDRVSQAPEGSRNQELNSQAFQVGRYVGAGLLDRSAAESTLSEAAGFVGLEEEEVQATIASGLGAGIADPHDIDELSRKLTSSGSDAGRELPPPPTSKDGRPTIVVEGGKLHEIVTQAEAALKGSQGDPIYQRGGMLVRLVRGQAVSIRDGIHRKPGALTIVPGDAPYLVDRLTESARFLKFNIQQGNYLPIDCPERVAKTLLARAGRWTFPELLGIVESPTLRPDGTVLEEPGYDEATRLYFDPGGTEFPPIEDRPTREVAVAAMAALKEILKGFPFVSAAGESVALAAFLTVLVRRSIRTAPLIAFSAPKMASGKSLLADSVAMVGTGRVASSMSQGGNDTEDRKRMLALLMEGDQVACIDNVERPLGGAALCSALTQDTWKDRVLGVSRVVTVPTAVTWLATGNNITFTGDISTRVLVCELDPKCERPEERVFDVDLRRFIPENRGPIVAACLTILRAYVVAGRPDMHLPTFGRFEEWSDLVRSALVWLNQADPCETRHRIERVDPVRQALRALLQSWSEVVGDRSVTAHEVIGAANKNAPGSAGALYAALREVATGKSEDIDARRLGHWLSRHERRIEDGLFIERMGERSGVVLWRVNHAS